MAMVANFNRFQLTCFEGIIYETSQSIYLPKSIHSNRYLNKEESKHIKASNVASPLANLNTRKEELHRVKAYYGGGHFGHFHDMYLKFIFAKRIAFNFGFHF
jgi:hypothetical protein